MKLDYSNDKNKWHNFDADILFSNFHPFWLSSAGAGVTSCLASGIFDTIWCSCCGPIGYTLVFARGRWRRSLSRFLEAERRGRSNSIIWLSAVYPIVVSGEIANTAGRPSCWWCSVVHVSSYVGACLTIVVPWLWSTTSKIMVHAEIVANLMSNDLQKFNNS